MWELHSSLLSYMSRIRRMRRSLHQIYKKISPKCYLVKFFISLPKTLAETGEFRPSKAGPCLDVLELVASVKCIGE